MEVSETNTGGNFFIIDNDGKKITKENVTGELVYKGKNVSTGYANNYKDLLKKNTNKKLLKTEIWRSMIGINFTLLQEEKQNNKIIW